jgi:hypothetical protein
MRLASLPHSSAQHDKSPATPRNRRSKALKYLGDFTNGLGQKAHLGIEKANCGKPQQPLFIRKPLLLQSFTATAESISPFQPTVTVVHNSDVVEVPN